jgi:hypothetical protein
LLQIDHDDFLPCWYEARLAHSTAFASRSRWQGKWAKYLGVVALGTGDRGFHVVFMWFSDGPW